MLKPRNEYIWFTPRYAINYFWNITFKEGTKSISSNKHKKAREAWIMGVALLGINKLTGQKWWLQVPQEDPPDMMCMFMQQNGNRNIMNYRLVEIMQITKYNKGTIKEEVQKKLHNKNYPKEYALLIYLQREEEFSDLRSTADEVKKVNPSISDIWCIGNTHPTEHNHILFSLYPQFQRTDFNIIEDCNKLPPGDHLKLKFAKGTKMVHLKVSEQYSFIP